MELALLSFRWCAVLPRGGAALAFESAALNRGERPPVDSVRAELFDTIVCRGETDIRPGRQSVAVDWHTVPTGSASGILVDAASRPIPGVELLFAARSIADSSQVCATERQKVRVITNRHGKFRCRGLPLGDWTVVVIDHPEFATTELKVEAGENIDLQIKQAN